MDETAVVLVDATGFIRYWSKGAEKVFGHFEQMVVGRSLDIIIPEAFRADHWSGFRLAMISGSAKIEGQWSSFPVLAAQGRIVNASGKLALLRDLHGKAVGAMVIFG